MVQAYPEDELSVHIVWVAALGSDNEAAAREIREMFDDPRVIQYWDPNFLVGKSYSTKVYPTYLNDMFDGLEASLPADHWWRESKPAWKTAKPENAPLWDVAFIYDKGAKWNERPPVAAGMVKQLFYYGVQENGLSGLFFTDFKKPPVDTDWIVELAKAMKKFTGKEPTRRAPNEPKKQVASAKSSGCTGSSIRAERIVLEVSGLSDPATAATVARALGAMKGAIRATADADSGLVQLLADTKSELTAERAIEFLSLSGYEAKEAIDGKHEKTTSPKRIQTGSNRTNRESDMTGQGSNGSSFELTSLAESLEPLRDHFNANKDKLRFVALLSPT